MSESIGPTLPHNIVTFVFTDVEGSTTMTKVMEEAVGVGRYESDLRDRQRDVLWQKLSQEWGGFEVQRQGDGHLYVFQNASHALQAVIAFQRALHNEPISYEAEGKRLEVKVRVGVHTSRVERDPMPNNEFLVEYPGTDTNFAARIGSLGSGGQIIVSDETHEKWPTLETPGCRYHPWPNRFLKSFEDAPHAVYEILYHLGQEPREPGLRFFPEFYNGERNRYVDRRDKEAEVIAQFQNKRNDGTNTRLVTIKAEGGMGKTRLAIACATKMVGLFEGHTHFVSLALVSPSKEAVAQAIGQAMQPPIKPALPNTVFEALKERGDNRTLLILDNYESAQNDDVARYLAKLVTQTRGVHLLVTGRTPVGISDVEQQVSLDGGMTHDEARELFLIRALLKKGSHWNPTPSEEPHLLRLLSLTSVEPEAEQICAIPLAVELVAGWVDVLTLREIADDLERFALGEVSAPPLDSVTSGPERQASMERSFRWSYDLLGRQANGARLQRSFVISSLFADSFDAATLTAVTKNATARTDLIRLHNASLVRRLEIDDHTRYYLHRFSRAFASGIFERQNDVSEVRRQFVAVYIERTNEARVQHLQPSYLSVMPKDWRNIMAAIQVAELMQDHDSILKLHVVTRLLKLNGSWLEAEQVTGVLANSGALSRRPDVQAIALLENGHLLKDLGQYQQATKKFQKCLEVCEALVQDEFSRSMEAGCYSGVGVIYDLHEDFGRALGSYLRALALYRRDGDRYEEAIALGNVGVLYRNHGMRKQALEHLWLSMLICEETQNLLGVARTQANLSVLYDDDGDHTLAIEWAHKALRIFEVYGDRVGQGRSNNNLAKFWRRKDDHDTARAFANKAFSLLDGTGSQKDLAEARQLVAELAE